VGYPARTGQRHCAEPEKLAAFYKELLEAEETETTVNRIEIRGVVGTRMEFRLDVNMTSPSRPRAENSFQVHLDFRVSDLDEAGRRVVGLGGRALETKDAGTPYEERVYADPDGHSFTFRQVAPMASELR